MTNIGSKWPTPDLRRVGAQISKEEKLWVMTVAANNRISFSEVIRACVQNAMKIKDQPTTEQTEATP